MVDIDLWKFYVGGSPSHALMQRRNRGVFKPYVWHGGQQQAQTGAPAASGRAVGRSGRSRRGGLEVRPGVPSIGVGAGGGGARQVKD